MLINRPEQVYTMLDAFRVVDVDTEDRLKRIQGILTDARENCIRSGSVCVPWLHVFSSVGSICLSLLGDYMNDVAFAKLLLDKHQRYGAEPLLEWMELGLLIRITSKVARVSNLMKNPNMPEGDESLNDTLRDIVGYCILGLYLKEAK